MGFREAEVGGGKRQGRVLERLYYLSHYLWIKGIPVLPRLIMLVIRIMYQSFIPYQLEIGPGVSFGHGVGIVINARARIGAGVKIRHHVTIGGGPAKIDDGVEVGSGARILGEVHIGQGARIGANAVVVRDVPPQTTVVGIPAKPVDKGVVFCLEEE